MDDLERALAILSYLGFKELATVKKLREVYVLDDVEVCLDRVEGLGEFVEVESRGASSRELVELLEELGAGELVAETYLELVLRRSSTPPSS
ncbi:MAG TPA: CYTH domain-containing protein [Thermofilaceae archaeon]|nr:CYTH domain-containing protein [Thermofilaceae archaeon]